MNYHGMFDSACTIARMKKLLNAMHARGVLNGFNAKFYKSLSDVTQRKEHCKADIFDGYWLRPLRRLGYAQPWYLGTNRELHSKEDDTGCVRYGEARRSRSDLLPSSLLWPAAYPSSLGAQQRHYWPDVFEWDVASRCSFSPSKVVCGAAATLCEELHQVGKRKPLLSFKKLSKWRIFWTF